MNQHEVDPLLPGYREDFTPDVEAGLRRLRARTGQTRPTAIRRLRPLRWVAAAAVALLLVGLGWWQLAERPVVLANAGPDPLEARLPDGSLVVLQSGSELRYPVTFAADHRRVDLSGQAYFDVVSNPELPFEVSGPDGVGLRVTGTTFNLRSDPDEFEVEVSEGTVLLRNDGTELPVSVHEMGTINLGSSDIRTAPSPNLNCHAWRTGELNFEGVPLEKVLKCIGSTFRVDVEHPAAAECTFPVSGHFQSTDPAEILGALARLGGGHLRQVGTDGTRFELTGLCD